MPEFSRTSLRRLDSCDKRLQKIMKAAILHYNFSVLEGYRGEKKQNDMYEQGYSHLKFPESEHNQRPSKAVDVAPYPIDWEDYQRFCYLAGLVKGVASQMGYRVRWGGDWDMDGEILSDQNFNDLGHFEVLD